MDPIGSLSVAKNKDNITEVIMVALKLIVLGMLVAAAIADDSTNEPVRTLSEKSFVKEDGYSFEFKTSDGVSRQEDAQLITVGDHQGIGVKGSYSYVAPDGQEYQVTFTADDKGYKPQIRIVPQGAQ